MKKTALYIAVLLVLVSGLFVDRAQAQSGACTRLTANIPFDFKIRNATLPAGEYEVTCSSTRTDVKVLELRRRGGSANAMVQTSTVSGKTSEVSKLVFNRYGDEYYLAQLWISDEPLAMQIRKSDVESGLSKQIALRRQIVETVARYER